MIFQFKKQLLAIAVFSMAILTTQAATQEDHLAAAPPHRVKRHYVKDLRKEGASHEWLRTTYKVSRVSQAAAVLPTSTDLRPYFGDIDDQGQLGSCTAFASTAALECVFKKEGLETPEEFSRLFQYWNTRSLEGTTSSDSGGTIADAIKALCKWGVCSEKDWPYTDKGDTFTKKPSTGAYAKARSFMNLDKGLNTIDNTVAANVKSLLAQGFPVVIGIDVYESFESDTVAKTGVVPTPNTRKEQLLGGHALVLAGYDDTKTAGGKTGFFLVRNSWGTDWGLSGYCWMGYDYLTNTKLASDFWAITKVGSIAPQPTPSNIAALVQAVKEAEQQALATFTSIAADLATLKPVYRKLPQIARTRTNTATLRTQFQELEANLATLETVAIHK